MSEFDGQIWALQENDDINFICVIKKQKNKIQALNLKGREQRVSEDKLLWKHHQQIKTPEEWLPMLNQIETAVSDLQTEIDIDFLWESAVELDLTEIKDFADTYFGNELSTEHFTAIWRTLAEHRLYFKRRGQSWEPRSSEQIEELKQQKAKEEARTQEINVAKEWLQELIKTPSPPFFMGDTEQTFTIQPIPKSLLPFIDRLEAWLRGDSDKMLGELIATTAENNKLNPRELAVDTLQKIGRLPLDVDRDVIIAGLKHGFSTTITEAAANLQPWQPLPEQTITELEFSIDDEETREVDDALNVIRDGDYWQIIIGIADPESVVHCNDTLDREAMRRGTTVYLPTQTVLMLPEKVSCDIASLTAGQVRSAIVLRAWLDEEGNLMKSRIEREAIRVKQRLTYIQADQLLNTNPDDTPNQAPEKLQQLSKLARLLHAKRQTNGAFNLQRPEFKISVYTDHIAVELIDTQSPSRLLVAEMMILGNHLAARYAQQNQVPIIYRIQDPPEQPITEAMTQTPIAFQKVRKLLKPSSLSLQPGSHSGLGLNLYTQLTSPLRRFADLVIQRQLTAHIIGDPLPYDQDELYKVLATAERTAKEARKIETESKKRWFAQYLKQSYIDKPLEVMILEPVKGGYKTEILPWGIDAFLGTTKGLETGDIVTAFTDKIRVRAANIRLKLAT